MEREVRLKVMRGTDDFGIAIGSLIINFAYFNSCLDGLVSAFLGLNKNQARCLVVPLQPREKVKLIRGYSKEYFEEGAINDIKALCKDCDKLIYFRNQIAHCHMVKKSADTPLQLCDYGGNKRFKPEYIDVEVQDLIEQSNKVRLTTQNIKKLTKAFLETN